ncbi:transcriptional repressor [Pyrinomonas sp.]|uniref:Fur family transcriptional regulator n=1 Tax=Pyrinomonas sp. TaxID=2080306 RepID=UPI00331B3831
MAQPASTLPLRERSNGMHQANTPVDEKEIFHQHIQRAGLKRTAQRDLILDVFLASDDHLSSEDLYRLVQEKDPTIGQTTVYRTLKLMTEAGIAREVRFGDGRTRYERNSKLPHHHHMICIECGHTIEFLSSELEAIQTEIAARYRFEPTQHSLRIFGLCAECRERAPIHRVPETMEPRVRLTLARAQK